MAITTTDERTVITPPRLARRWGVSIEKILTLITRGLLPGAFNAALETGPGKRPRWLIPLEAVEAFERSRAAVPPAPAQEEGPHAA
jgi:hypothetical protein